MKRSNIWEIIAKSLAGEIGDEEKAILKDWMGENEEHGRIYKDLCRLHILSVLPAETSAVRRKIRERLENEIVIQPDQEKQRKHILWSWAIAASVLLVVSLGLFWVHYLRNANPSQMLVMNAGTGKILKVTLPDSSVVWLNSGSQLVYPSHFANKEREVFVTGEAFFYVTHDPGRLFIVKTGPLNICVHGTTFDVKSYLDEESIKITLVDGSIALEKTGEAHSSAIYLTPSYQALYNRVKGSIQLLQVDTEPYLSWKDGVLAFRSSRFEDIARSLERLYGFQIIIRSQKLRNETYTGRFDRNESISDILKVIQISTPFSYRIRDKIIDIY